MGLKMEITVESIIDNDDGSCQVEFNMDADTLKVFACLAIKDALISAANKIEKEESQQVDDVLSNSDYDNLNSAFLDEIELLENKLEKANKKNQILYDALNLMSIGTINDIILMRWTADEALDKVEKIGEEE
jgi:site-specific DNA-adenine methylase